MPFSKTLLLFIGRNNVLICVHHCFQSFRNIAWHGDFLLVIVVWAQALALVNLPCSCALWTKEKEILVSENVCFEGIPAGKLCGTEEQLALSLQMVAGWQPLECQVAGTQGTAFWLQK